MTIPIDFHFDETLQTLARHTNLWTRHAQKNNRVSEDNIKLWCNPNLAHFRSRDRIWEPMDSENGAKHKLIYIVISTLIVITASVPSVRLLHSLHWRFTCDKRLWLHWRVHWIKYIFLQLGNRFTGLGAFCILLFSVIEQFISDTGYRNCVYDHELQKRTNLKNPSISFVSWLTYLS